MYFIVVVATNYSAIKKHLYTMQSVYYTESSVVL